MSSVTLQRSDIDQWNRMLTDCPEKLFIKHVMYPDDPPRRLIDLQDWCRESDSMATGGTRLPIRREKGASRVDSHTS